MSLPNVEVSVTRATKSPKANCAGPCTARPTSSTPQPYCGSTPYGPLSCAVVSKVVRRLSLSIQRKRSCTSTAAPVTSGADSDVPCSTWMLSGLSLSRPGR
ncbi:Uncharacterised protein [Bordetella pertussis]|nr:Uncharacterised protein [Bordetella pertussis]